MDFNILTEIRQTISAGIILLGALALSYLAPGLAMDWTKKLIWLSVTLGLWLVFVTPSQQALEAIFIYTFNVFLYKMLTENTVIFIYQALLFLITFRLFTWLFDIHAPHHHNSPTPHKK